MRGFCTQGILLFPKAESYTHRNESYHTYMRKALKNIIDYFKEKEISLGIFTTDEVGILANPADVFWIQALPPEDAFFVKNNCDNMGKSFVNPELYPEIYSAAKRKFPVTKGLTREQRFEIVLKRNQFITKRLIENAKLIVHFVTPNNCEYSAKPKEGDGKIILEIHNGNFIIKSYMSGMEVDPISFMELPYANNPLQLWEAMRNGANRNG